MSTFSNTAREVEMPNGDIVKLHDAVTPNSTSNIKKFKYDDNGHVTESEAANATDLNLNSYATPTSGTTAIGTSDNVQTAIGKLDHQSHIDQTNILSVKDMVCDDAFSTSKSYAVGDITIYDNKLYKFKNAHQGAWSASDVDQISLSEQNSDFVVATNNIQLLTKYGGGINKLRHYHQSETIGEVVFTVNDDESITIYTNGTASANRYVVIVGASDEVYVDSTDVVTGLNDYPGSGVYFGWGVGASGNSYSLYSNESSKPVGATGYLRYFAIYVAAGVNLPQANAVTVNPMIISAQDYAKNPSYQPYALSNAIATPALIEQVDGGAKNLINCSVDNIKSLNSSSTFSWNGNTVTAYGRTATVNADGTITVAAGTGSAEFWLKVANYTYASGVSYVLSGCPTDGSRTTYYMESDNLNLRDIGSGVEINSTTTDALYVVVKTTGSTPALTFKPMLCTKAAFGVSQKFVPFGNDPFYQVPINHNMIYRGRNLGATLTDAQHTALSSGNFTDLYLGDYWTKSVTIPDFYELTTAQPSDWTTNYTSYYTKSGNTYTAVTGSSAPTWTANTYYQKSVPAQTVTLKAVIADFDTFYAGYASSYAAINTHHAAVIVTGFNKVVWNKTNTTAGGYVNSLIHKWLVGSVLPEMETWFGSAKVLSHQKLLTNAITGDAASGWAWSSQKIALLSENQMYGSKVWGNSKAANGGYEPGEAFKHLNVFNHIDANLLFGNKNIWLRDIASAVWAARLNYSGNASNNVASDTWIAPAALILLS